MTISWEFWSGLLANLFSSFVGVLTAYLVGKYYYDRRFAGWRVRLIQDGKERLNRSISPRKAREICDEPADLSVFLKGIASPYGYVQCDIIQDGEELGLLGVEEERKDWWRINRSIRRTYTIDMDKNPPKPASSKPQPL